MPLSHILSMSGLAQYQLAQWMTSIIDPAHLLCSGNCLLSSFTFAHKFKIAEFASSVFLCSFGICILFTNVSLAETIYICACSLRRYAQAARFQVQCLLNQCKWPLFYLKSVLIMSCSGNLVVWLWISFLAKHWLISLLTTTKPNFSKQRASPRRITNTSMISPLFSNDEEDYNEFLSHLNSLHCFLCLAFEKDSNSSSPFLDVLVGKSKSIVCHKKVCLVATRGIGERLDRMIFRFSSFCHLNFK